MRIAFITQSYPPMISGAALVVERLAHGMAERGHPTLVLAASDKGQPYTEEIGNLRIVRLASLPNPKRANQHFTPIAIPGVAKEIQSFQPDILHIHELFMGIGGIIMAQWMDIPMVGTIHQLPWFVSAYLPNLPSLKDGVENTIWSCSRWLDSQFDELVVPTPTIAQTIYAEAGFKPLDISNGVDLSHFTQESVDPDEKEYLCRKYELDPSRPIILHVGRLDCDKSVEKVVEAAAKTLRMTNAQMLIAGDGECKEALQNQAKNLGIWEDCHFPGFISAKGDLPGVYRMADVFATASEIETQGLVLLEALASGLPVVAVEATCIPELVHNTINGFLHQPNDVDAFADSLTHLIHNPVQARQMGQVGRRLAEKHSIQYALNQHENLYQKTIVQHRKAIHTSWRGAWMSHLRFF